MSLSYNSFICSLLMGNMCSARAKSIYWQEEDSDSVHPWENDSVLKCVLAKKLTPIDCKFVSAISASWIGFWITVDLHAFTNFKPQPLIFRQTLNWLIQCTSWLDDNLIEMVRGFRDWCFDFNFMATFRNFHGKHRTFFANVSISFTKISLKK